MKRSLILMIGLAWAAASARADLLITLDNPAQTGASGDTLLFTGVLSNTGSETVYLNSADLNLAGTSFTTNFLDLFFNSVPASLGVGQATLDIELFDVTVNNPFTDPLGIYSGAYDLIGGSDGSAQDLLASAVFTVNAVPEPPAALFLAAALVAALIGSRSGRLPSAPLQRRPGCSWP